MSQIESGITDETTTEDNAGTETEPRTAPRPRGRPRKVVMMPGDKAAKPTELDMLSNATIPGEIDANDDVALDIGRQILAAISATKTDGRRWNSYSAFQRYAMLGAATVLQEILEVKDFNGQKASFTKLLGVNIVTHRTLGANAG